MNDSIEEVGCEALSECPICCYSLEGLPSEHTCPECGFEFDESMRAWRASRWRVGLFCGGLTMVFFVGAAAYMMGIWRRGGGGFVDVAAVLVNVGAGLAYGRIWFRPPAVVVGKTGIMLTLLGARPRHIGWEEIEYVLPTAVVLRSARFGIRKRALPSFLFMNRSDRDGLAAYLKAVVPGKKFRTDDR